MEEKLYLAQLRQTFFQRNILWTSIVKIVTSRISPTQFFAVTARHRFRRAAVSNSSSSSRRQITRISKISEISNGINREERQILPLRAIRRAVEPLPLWF